MGNGTEQIIAVKLFAIHQTIMMAQMHDMGLVSDEEFKAYLTKQKAAEDSMLEIIDDVLGLKEG